MSSTTTLAGRLAALARRFRRDDDTRSFDASSPTSQPGHEIDDNGGANGLHNGSGNGHDDGPDNEPRPPRRWLTRRRESSRERSVAQLQHAYDEVIDLVGTLKQHIEAQSERSERLLTMMEGLPEALKSLPEANRNQTQTLQTIENHLKQQHQHSEGLTQAIQGLAKAAGNQEHAMNLIQHQLDAGQESREQLHENFNALGKTLGHMSETNQASAQMLSRLHEQQEQNEAQLERIVTRSQRQMTAMSIVSWALAILALGIAGAVAVWVGQTMNQSASGPQGNAPVEAAYATGFEMPASHAPATGEPVAAVTVTTAADTEARADLVVDAVERTPIDPSPHAGIESSVRTSRAAASL